MRIFTGSNTASRSYASVLAALDKAEMEARRGRMELLHTDVLLQRAACYLTFWPNMAESERSDVRKLTIQVLAESARRVSAMGYARRAAMLRQLQEAAEDVGISRLIVLVRRRTYDGRKG